MNDKRPAGGAVARALELLRARGLDPEIREFSKTTRTARDAAAAVGCEVQQIAKSLVFRGRRSDRLVLAITSGRNRADDGLIADAVGEPVSFADADFVRARTGFAIGGVPPIAAAADGEVTTLIDRDLMALDELWAAAGTPNAVFRLTPAELESLTGGSVATLAAKGPAA